MPSALSSHQSFPCRSPLQQCCILVWLPLDFVFGPVQATIVMNYIFLSTRGKNKLLRETWASQSFALRFSFEDSGVPLKPLYASRPENFLHLARAIWLTQDPPGGVK